MSSAFHPWPAAFLPVAEVNALLPPRAAATPETPPSAPRALGLMSKPSGPKSTRPLSPAQATAARKSQPPWRPSHSRSSSSMANHVAFQLVARRLLVAATNTEAAPNRIMR